MFHEGPNQKPALWRGFFAEKTNFCDLSVMIPTVRSFRKFNYYCFVSIIKLLFLSNYSLWFFQPKSPSNTFQLWWPLQLRNFFFDPFIGFLTVQLFQKVVFILISLDVRKFNSEPPSVRCPPSKTQSKTQHS